MNKQFLDASKIERSGYQIRKTYLKHKFRSLWIRKVGISAKKNKISTDLNSNFYEQQIRAIRAKKCADVSDSVNCKNIPQLLSKIHNEVSKTCL